MLLESHAGEISLLPALPKAWPEGRVKGLKARGGVEVEVAWRGGKEVSAVLTAAAGGTHQLRANGKVQTVALAAGRAKKLTFT